VSRAGEAGVCAVLHPLKWTEIGRGSDNRLAHVSGVLHRAEGGHVASLDIPPSAVRDEMGEEIARRWNAYPALLAALDETVGDLESAYDNGQGARPTAVSAAIHRARAALSSARGEG
jgi:hypothetical protein